MLILRGGGHPGGVEQCPGNPTNEFHPNDLFAVRRPHPEPIPLGLTNQ